MSLLWMSTNRRFFAILLSHNTFGLHCGVWVVDCPSHQAYNVSIHSVLRALVMGMGQNCPKASPVSHHQGQMTCASMVGQLNSIYAELVV